MSLAFWLFIAFYVSTILLHAFVFHIKKETVITVAMWSMIAGIVFLCQPLSAFLFHYGIGVLFFGLLWWNIGNNMKKTIQSEEGCA